MDLILLITDTISSDNLGYQPLDSDLAESPTDLYVIGHPYGSYGQLPRQVQKNLKEMASLENILGSSTFKDELIARQSPSSTTEFLLIDGSILPGDSGSPILDQNDRVIGIVDGGIVGGTGGIGWAIPWSEVGKWSEPKGELFEKLKQHEVDKLFSFASEELTADREEILITLIDELGRQSTIPKKVLTTEEANYEIVINDSGLRNFNPTKVRIKEVSNDGILLADGATQRELSSSNDKFISFRLDNEGTYFKLKVTPKILDSVEFNVMVINSCNEKPLGQIPINFVVKTQDNVEINKEEIKTTTSGKASKLVNKDRENIKLFISIEFAGYTHFHEEYKLSTKEVTVRLEPNSPCSVASSDTFTNTVAATNTPTPTFVAPKIYLVPNRISKERLVNYLNTTFNLSITVNNLERVNPNLSDLVEIDTIIVIPTSTP